MKITIHKNSIVFVGKGWEIIEQLESYKMKYKYVQDWIEGKKQL